MAVSAFIDLYESDARVMTAQQRKRIEAAEMDLFRSLARYTLHHLKKAYNEQIRQINLIDIFK
jgi:hypothetical protein